LPETCLFCSAYGIEAILGVTGDAIEEGAESSAASVSIRTAEDVFTMFKPPHYAQKRN
jgi:hypothetical protein